MKMLEELQQIYGDYVIINKKVDAPENYLWFQTDEGIPFAIRKNIITENEKKLISLTFKPYQFYLQNHYTKSEGFWASLLFEDTSSPNLSQPLISVKQYQFIHFFCKQTVLEKNELNDTLLGFLPENAIILWKTDHHGVMITQENMEDPDSFADIITSIATDFFIDLYIYVGSHNTDIHDAKDAYIAQEALFQMCRDIFPNRRVYQHHANLPLNLINHWMKDHNTDNFDMLINLVEAEDDEMILSVSTFLESNMNISIASKELYIHRNSLQYRLDKFHEKTGLNPKDFQDAITIYLLLLHRRVKAFIKVTQKNT